MSELVETYLVSRKAIYDLVEKGNPVLQAGLQPDSYGARLSE